MTTVTCKISDELNARLEMRAKRERVTKSFVLRDALENRIKKSRAAKHLCAFDLVKHLSGSLRGPTDLSTNPKHMKGFGE